MTQDLNFYDAAEKGEAIADFKEQPASPEAFLPVSPTSTETTITVPSKHEQELKSTNQLVSGSASSRVSIVSRIQQLFTGKNKSHFGGRKSIVRTLEECPAGYPRLAAFLDSDENFMLYRRFGFLQARVLLYKQDELRELEVELDKMDQRDSKTRPKRLKSRERDDAENEDRRTLIQNITRVFSEYAELLKSARELTSLNQASARNYESVVNYFNSADPLCNDESYIYRKEDIITLKPGRENSWLDAVVEKILQKFSCPLIRKLFCDEDLRRKADPKATKVILYSRERINIIVSLLITLMISALLIVPVYVLWKLARTTNFTNTTTAVIVGVLLVCTLVFSGVLSLFTRAKRHEILAASAGYCAVLVVFIGNIVLKRNEDGAAKEALRRDNGR